MAATDETLVRGTLNGDRAAFAQLYDQRARLIRAICYDETRDPESAADLTQEVFLRAYGKLATLRDPSKFAAWLVGIARQVCREWRRGRSREDSALQRVAASAPGSPTVPGPYLVDLSLRELRDAVASLPEKERLAVHAFYLQEQDADQARRVLGLSRSGLYYVLASARCRLRRSLSREAAAGWLVAAAVVVVAVLLVVDLGNGVAFADVVERLREIHTLTCRVQRVKVTGDQAQTIEARMYLSEEHGLRSDFHYESGVITRFEPLDGPKVTVMPKVKTCMVLKVPGADGARRDGPEEGLRRLRSLTEDAAAEPLGHRLLEGRRVRGFRIAGDQLDFDDPLISAELWVDDDTGLPVKFVLFGPWLQPGTRATQTFDRFEWNPPLAADLFVPIIPDDYQRIEQDLSPPSESELIRGLRSFAELAGGYFPESMDFNRADKELTRLFHMRVADPTFPELMRRAAVLFNACRFYARLADERREPEYFGTEVWAEDTDCVLIRWRLNEKQLRVVYADLRVETVPAHEEAGRRCQAPPGRRRPELPPDQAAVVSRSWGATFPW